MVRNTAVVCLGAAVIVLIAGCALFGGALPASGAGDARTTLEGLQTSFREIARDVVPVVVSVNVHDISGGSNPWDFFFQEPDQKEDKPREKDYEQYGMGSGVIVERKENKYFLLTNYHVIKGGKEITAVLADGREYQAVIVGFDERKDLALLSLVSTDELPVARLGDSDALKVGDWVIAVGNPYGWQSSVTSGIVSALGRRLDRNANLSNVSDFIQTDANINPGNSGGALVNLRGEVVGINTWITSPTGGSIGIGFAIPVNNAKKLVRDLVRGGKPEYAWLGVSIVRMITSDAEKELGIHKKKGAFINYVIKGSPAERGGLWPGDLVTAINGRAVTDENHLIQLASELETGVPASFALIRLGQEQTIELTLTSRPAESVISGMAKGTWPGFVTLPLSSAVREKYKIAAEETGVVVFFVEQGGPAFSAGLHAGDLVKKIGGKEIKTMLDYYRAINERSAARIEVSIVRGGSAETVTLDR
jgi:serine protease Do